MKLCVMGAGAWGTALAVAYSADHDVTLWTRDADHALSLHSSHCNERYLPGIALPPGIEGREQDADAEIEAVHHHIGENRKGDDEGPDDGEIHHTGSFSPGACVGSVSSPPGFWVGPGVIPAVRIGPTSPRFTPYSPACGALPISLRIYHTPMPNTVK